MSNKANGHQEIVKKLLDTKAIDFNAIGRTVAELGPSLALMEEPWEVFCGTMRVFVHVYQLGGVQGTVEELGQLRSAAAAAAQKAK